MKHSLNQPWETTQVSFSFETILIRSPLGFFFVCTIGDSTLRPINEQVCFVIRPFLPNRRTGGHLHD